MILSFLFLCYITLLLGKRGISLPYQHTTLKNHVCNNLKRAELLLPTNNNNTTGNCRHHALKQAT
jgi:hypothetical protein